MLVSSLELPESSVEQKLQGCPSEPLVGQWKSHGVVVTGQLVVVVVVPVRLPPWVLLVLWWH
eukprot:9722344-Karenia_brevis.AAC.1